MSLLMNRVYSPSHLLVIPVMLLKLETNDKVRTIVISKV